MAVTANCKLKKVLIRSLSGLRKVFFNLVKYRINKTEAFAFLRATIDEKNLDSKPAQQLNGQKELVHGLRFFFFFYILKCNFFLD